MFAEALQHLHAQFLSPYLLQSKDSRKYCAAPSLRHSSRDPATFKDQGGRLTVDRPLQEAAALRAKLLQDTATGSGFPVTITKGVYRQYWGQLHDHPLP